MSIHPSFPWKIILEWHEKNGRHDLPWRQYFHRSDKDRTYHVWLSEILLQQTQVSRGIVYYEKILAHYPTIESLAASPYEEFFEYYQGLGYYSRARNMLLTAKIVEEKYAGIFPNDLKALQSLPGVGPYTAAAIMSFAYDTALLSFDTNLLKIFARYYYGDRSCKLSRDEIVQIQTDFASTGVSGRSMNAALMDFASLISVNSVAQIDWEQYILHDCTFYQTRGSLEAAKVKTRVIFPIKDAQIMVMLHKDHTIYYSSRSTSYAPFLLPPTENDIRHDVQAYFRGHFGLEVSVRPVHAKYYDEQDVPCVACYAQVQKGMIEFREYAKNDI